MSSYISYNATFFFIRAKILRGGRQFKVLNLRPPLRSGKPRVLSPEAELKCNFLHRDLLSTPPVTPLTRFPLPLPSFYRPRSSDMLG